MRNELLLASVSLISALSLSGCAPRAASSPQQGTPPATAADAPGHEFDPQAFYSRELQPLAKKPIQFEKLSGEAEGQAPTKVENHETSFEVTIPIGTESPLECFVYKSNVDPGGTLLMINREAAKKVDVRLFKVAEVSLVGDYPVVFLEAQYLAKTAKGQALGELKSMFYQHPVSPMLCLHDEVGYNETFRRMTKSLAASLKIADVQVNPTKLTEIYLNKFGGHPAGFSSHVVLSDKSGKLTFLSRSSSFLPQSQRELAIQDSVSTEVWDAKGGLLEAAYAESEAGELSMSISLKKLGPQEYAYKGKQGGQPVSGKFKTKSKRGLATDKITNNLVATELLTGKSKELKLEEYHANLDPKGPTLVSYKTESRENRQIEIEGGSMALLATADDSGMLEKVEMAVGGVNMSHERVVVRGSP